ncbi:ferredoxin [Candidatus Pacearchaeota archaeon]|nr:ferredoxin [Candidatus Pacearchaeota archaeon]
MSKIKLIHRRDKCIGCNVCFEASPSNWKINQEDGKADLIGGKEVKKGLFIKEISEAEKEENKLAEDNCPMGIIDVVEN